MKKSFKVVFIFSIVMFFSSPALIGGSTDNPVDMTDRLLKVSDPAIFHHQVMNGFAVLDIGDKKLKFFDWNFKIAKQIPVTLGEGPGEIKQKVLSLCTLEGKMFVIGLMEKKLKIYKGDGSFIKSLPLGFMPKEMVAHKGELYVFNMGYGVKKKNPLLCKVFSPDSDEAREIILKDDLQLDKVAGGHPVVLGLSSLFSISGNGTVYILINEPGILLEIDGKGKLLRKVTLPYKERTLIRAVKEGKEEQTVMSTLDLYQSMKVLENDLYATFLKHVKKDKKTGHNVYKTHVIKIRGDGKFPGKVFDGDFVIVGHHNHRLYLFDSEDYRIISTELK